MLGEVTATPREPALFRAAVHADLAIVLGVVYVALGVNHPGEIVDFNPLIPGMLQEK